MEPDQPQPVLLDRPPKPISQMTDEELDDWADRLIDALIDATQ